MQRRSLGTDGFETSAIGLGCMGFSQGYGPADDAESLRALRSAFDCGITLLDTAMSYGQGHNEELIGRALAAHTGGRIEVATKYGISRTENGVYLDGRPENVRAYCEASLTRLGLDTIDLYYLHRADPDVPVAESVGAMAELVREGKIRHVGVSELTAGQLAEAASAHPVTAVEFEWSLLWREPEDEIVPAARRLGIGLVPYSPLGRGLLTATLARAEIGTSDFRGTDPRFQGAELDANLALIAVLRELAAERGATAGQLALAWLLAQGPDVVPLPGSRRPDRIRENAAAADLALGPADLARIEDAMPRSAWAGSRASFAVPHTARAHSRDSADR
ncbi:MAG TPA: aldo/keto reductase [Actinocrinis sp.]|nr:aldo/keto reductase [Actinocrinis sp.]